MRQRAYGEKPGMIDLADDEDLDAVQPAHRNINLNASNLVGFVFDQVFGLGEAQAGDLDRAELRQQERAVALDVEMEGLIDAAPHQDVELVARTNHVFVA